MAWIHQLIPCLNLRWWLSNSDLCPCNCWCLHCFLPKHHGRNWLWGEGWGGIGQSSSNSIMIIMPFCQNRWFIQTLTFPSPFYRGQDRDTITLYDTRGPANVGPKGCRSKIGSTRQLRLPLPVGDKLLCTWTALEGFCLRSSSRFSSSWCLRGKLKYLNSEGMTRFYVGGNAILKVGDGLYKCALTRTSTCRFELEFMMKSGLKWFQGWSRTKARNFNCQHSKGQFFETQWRSGAIL